MRLTMQVLSIAVGIASSTASAQIAPTDPQVLATGRGEARIKPTRAVVSFTVQGRGATAAIAASENAATSAATMKSLLSAGLKPDDITNNAYNVMPDYEYSASNGRKLLGFVASNGIRVEIARIADVGRVIDAGLAGGATMVSSAQYSGENMGDARRSALKAAMDEARRDAETMATAAGGTLGRIVLLTNTSTSSTGVQDTYFERAVAGGVAAGSTIMRPNELTVSAGVTVRWEFVPGK